MDKELQKKLLTEVMHQDEDDGLYDMDKDDKISRILKLELEITRAVINGHRPSEDDQYQEKRKELERLREEVDKTFKKKSLWKTVERKQKN